MQEEPGSEIAHWEDIRVGDTVPFGGCRVTKEEIVEFARTFDPQSFHLDEEAARSSVIGRLCASGWHSCAILMRMYTDAVLSRMASLGSPGIDEGKWLKPVFPGDELSGRCTYLSKRLLRSRPGVGLCQVLVEMVNQQGEVVVSWTANQLVRVRQAGSAS